MVSYQRVNDTRTERWEFALKLMEYAFEIPETLKTKLPSLGFAPICPP